MKVSFATLLTLVCGAATVSAACTGSGALSNPKNYGNSLMATFTNPPGLCAAPTTAKPGESTVAPASTTAKVTTTGKPATTKEKVTTTEKPTTTKKNTTKAPTTVTTTNTTFTTTTTTITTTVTTTNTTSHPTTTVTTTNTTLTTTTTQATSTNTTTTTTVTTTVTTTNTTATTTSTNYTTTTTVTTTVTTTNTTVTTLKPTQTTTNTTFTTTTTTVTTTQTTTNTTEAPTPAPKVYPTCCNREVHAACQAKLTNLTCGGLSACYFESGCCDSAGLRASLATVCAMTNAVGVNTCPATGIFSLCQSSADKAAADKAAADKAAADKAAADKAAADKKASEDPDQKCLLPCVAPDLVAKGECAAMAASTTKECKLATHSVVQSCLGIKADYSCPTNNNDLKRKPDFVSAQAIKCKSCSASTTITDLDPEAGKFWVALEWGPLMSSKGEFVEDNIEGYEVFIVDSKGRKLMKVGFADKVKSAKKCCTKDMYSFTVAGDLPKGYSKFMIVPTVRLSLDTTANLPMGVLTSTIIDVSSGVVTKIKGSFTIKVSNAALFATDKKVNAALREAVADTIPGIDKSSVRITKVSVVARRLAANRRLDAGTVKVEYEIVVPESYTGKAITTATIVPATLMKAINTRVAAKGFTNLEVTEAPVIAAIETKEVGTPKAAGGASRSAQMGFIAAAFGFAAVLGMMN